ncbi:hypothetical protein LGH82_30770 [Mesorhizobium sp. PAMC28654]|uniref:hypothetical protein n=1 Tax=Mesorhizobium sp. PAMC28654 TaxID=2880934 RepID=UPI001D0B2E59|nr:hypothetical protein [Mesorhizobium sp. PAMC28654]UDL89394.1 hypothetical protein LGH82_30770 [Mesorhizobium sp. PAMC28654]
MELPLTDGLLPDYPCDQRMVLLFVASVVLLSCLCALAFWLTMLIPLPETTLGGSVPGGRYSARLAENQGLDSSVKGARSAPIGLFALAILIASVVVSFSHSKIHVVATDTSIIGTSCHMASTYRDVFNRATAEITYRYRYGKHHNRSDWLEVSQEGNKPLRIWLRHNPYLNNLSQVAPAATHAYLDQIQADGESMPAGFSR